MPLLAAAVIVAAFAAGALAQEAQPGGTVPVYEPKPAAPTVPKIAVYITGNAPEDKKKTVGTRLLVALVKTGRYASIERPSEFAEAAESVRASTQGAASAEEYIYELGKAYGVKYVCIAEVTAQADDYQILARVINVKTAQVAAIGDFYGPIKTAADLKPALDELVETMFAKPKDAAATPQPAPPPQSGATDEAASAVAVPTAAASTPAVTVTGPAKDAVEKVIAAVNAFKDAMAKSVAAASAVATAAQSKNFSAIMAAKKSVESAAAVKKAKEDGLAAVEALKAAGPEAEEAARAMGINLAMFAGGGKDGKKKDAVTGSESTGKVYRDYFPPKDAGKGKAALGFGYSVYSTTWGKLSYFDLSLNARYSIIQGLEAAITLPLPMASSVTFSDGVAGTIRFIPEKYAGLGSPKVGARYWLPTGPGFLLDVTLPIDTRDGMGSRVTTSLGAGIQYSVNFAEKLSLGSQIRCLFPFANSETKIANGADLSIGMELDYSLGMVTPFLGVVVSMGLTKPAVDGRKFGEADKLGVNPSAGVSFEFNRMLGADVSLGVRSGERYGDNSPVTAGARLLFNF
jgi:hypothetical protein